MEIELHAVQHIPHDGIIPFPTAVREPRFPYEFTQR